jgi:hypothetical protein
MRRGRLREVPQLSSIMPLARKGTRRITVNGDIFRWCVAPNDEPGMAIVVESAASAGQRMVTWVEHGNTISPWLVRRAILNALACGWNPHARGKEVVFRFAGLMTRENVNT